MKLTKLVIPTAGFGTRMLPITKAIPKEMLPILNKPVIQYIVEEAVAAGITDIIMITGYHKRAIEDHFDHAYELEDKLEKAGKIELKELITRIPEMANFTFIRQKGPYGTASAVNSARHLLGNEPFAVLWGDIIASPQRLQTAVKAFEKLNSPVVCAEKRTNTQDYDTYGYIKGRLISENLWEVSDLIEKPGIANKPSDLAVLNGYILTSDIWPVIEQLQPTEKGEYCLVKAINELAKQIKIHAVELNGIRQCDTGNKLEYLKTVFEHAMDDPEIALELKKHIRNLLK